MGFSFHIAFTEVYKDVIPTMVISGPHFLAHEIDNIQQVRLHCNKFEYDKIVCDYRSG